MKIINLTPYKIRLLNSDGEIMSEYLSQGVAKVRPVYYNTFMLGNIPVKMLNGYEGTDIPEPSDNNKFIVTPDVKAAFSHRLDFMTIDREIIDVKRVFADNYTISIKEFII